MKNWRTKIAISAVLAGLSAHSGNGTGIDQYSADAKKKSIDCKQNHVKNSFYKENKKMKTMSFTPVMKRQSFPFAFGNFFNDEFFGTERAAYVPAVNISESNDAYAIEVSAPGFPKDAFKIAVEDLRLTISADFKSENKETKEEKNYYRREFRHGSFSRSFTLPENKVNLDGISAKYENGILFVTVPKQTNEVKRNLREISIA
jgi:HSP20 family protein